MLKGDAFLGWTMVDKGTLAQGDINITIHGPKKPPEEKMEKGSGDFTDCMDRIIPAMTREGRTPDDPEAFCADYEHRQTGHWPGEKSAYSKKSIGTDTFLFGNGIEEIEKEWSDASREAAAEARRNNARARSRDEGGPTEAKPTGSV